MKGRSSLKVIRNYTVEQVVYKFLLLFHCNYVAVFNLVPFLRYSTSNNGVPWNMGQGSFAFSCTFMCVCHTY